MLGSLLGSSFSAKCKQSIKCVKARAFERRKKKQALLNFLKKDIADLLVIHEEDNAFGRMDKLIIEANHVSCYDMIERFCEVIKSQLPTLQKRRECSEEVMEAMATLIYAAARFSDLPELCDLRLVFTNRYGSTMEPSVSQEFVEKISMKSFPKERKLKMMQEIANEFSVKWDSKDFGQQKTLPAALVRSKTDVVEHKEKQVNTFNAPPITRTLTAVDASNRQGDPAAMVNVTRQDVHSVAKESHVVHEQVKKIDLHLLKETKDPLVLKPKTTEKTPAPLSENPIAHDRKTPGLWLINRSDGDPPTPPYVKTNGQRNGVNGFRGHEGDRTINVERQVVGTLKPETIKTVDTTPPYVNGGRGHGNDRAIDVKRQDVGTPKPEIIKMINTTPPYFNGGTTNIKRQDVGTLKPEIIKTINAAPPYVKDQSLKDVLPVMEMQAVNRNAHPAINRVPPYLKPSASKENENAGLPTENLVGEGRGEPRSMRRNKHSLKTIYQNDGDEAVVNVDERIDEIVYGIKRHDRRGIRSFDAEPDEDDMAIDRMLMHYSTKGMYDKAVEAEKRIPKNHDVHISKADALDRVRSLPSVRSNATDPLVHQNDMKSRGGRVHPRQSDYDKLAGRFNAVKMK